MIPSSTIVKIETHIQSIRQHNVRIQRRRNKNTHTATESVHSTVRKLSIRRRKTEVVENANKALGNNYVAFIFDEIQYGLNSMKIERNRNVETSNILHTLSMNVVWIYTY